MRGGWCYDSVVRLLLVCLSVASLVARADALLVDRIVAVVDLQAITRSAVDERARTLLPAPKTDAQKTQVRREALISLIEDALIFQDARRLKLEVRDEEVEAALGEVARQNQISVAELIAETRRQGFENDSYRAVLKQKILELKWLNVRSNRMAEPEAEADRGAFLMSQRTRLIAELRATAVIEVRE